MQFENLKNYAAPNLIIKELVIAYPIYKYECAVYVHAGLTMYEWNRYVSLYIHLTSEWVVYPYIFVAAIRWVSYTSIYDTSNRSHTNLRPRDVLSLWKESRLAVKLNQYRLFTIGTVPVPNGGQSRRFISYIKFTIYIYFIASRGFV